VLSHDSLAALSRRSWQDGAEITRDEFFIMSYRVFGFILDTRKWGGCPFTGSLVSPYPHLQYYSCCDTGLAYALPIIYMG